MLWGVSAGICEFKGCSACLFEHHVTKENVNLAQRAHIYAFSEGGKRYSRLVPKKKINDIDNLMLVCGSCHDLIDSTDTNYSAEKLLAMKKEHEERIRLLVSIKPNYQSEVIIYNCNIGDKPVRINAFQATESIIPEYYPARKKPINLSPNLKLYDYEKEYWNTMDSHLCRSFEQYEASLGDKHISLFAVAPQPLLFRLGILLNRHYNVATMQPQGNIALWRWREEVQTVELDIIAPLQKKVCDRAAMTFEITAPLSDEELKALFHDQPAYRIVARNFTPDAIKSKADLAAVIEKYRIVLNQIRKECAPNVEISLFPIAPPSISVEAGRQLMKGDPRITIYDRKQDTKIWEPALTFHKEGE